MYVGVCLHVVGKLKRLNLNSSNMSSCLLCKVFNTPATVTSIKPKFPELKVHLRKHFINSLVRWWAWELVPKFGVSFFLLADFHRFSALLSFYFPVPFFRGFSNFATFHFCNFPSFVSASSDFFSWFLPFSSNPKFLLSHILSNFYLNWDKARESILLNITVVSSTINFWVSDQNLDWEEKK